MLKQNLSKIRFLFKGILLILLTDACANSTPQPFYMFLLHPRQDTFMNIRLQGTLDLPEQDVNGLTLAELSGIAWDDDEEILYAISDNGYLFHLHPIIVDHVLTSVRYETAYRLRDKLGKALPSTDSEGLTLRNERNGIAGDTELIISFERIPRIAGFTPGGEWLKEYTLPEPLKNTKNYLYPNTMLEAVTLHPQWGILTTPERPLRGNTGKVIIYALDGQHRWQFPSHSAPKSAVVALETLADGSILVLERAFVSKFRPLIISLRQITLSHCQSGKKPSVNCKPKQIFVFNNSKGWRIDNFEGLTRHRAKHFFMISDNGQNFFQRTLLSYFEILSLETPKK